MAAKKKPERPEFVARAGGYGLTAEGVWVVLTADDAPAVEPVEPQA